MAENHPSELHLLAYVENELASSEREAVSGHLAGCPGCAEQVALLAAGRKALRAAPLLELPEERRRETIAALPERREPWRAFRPVRRWVVVAAPATAAAALAAVVVLAATQLGGGGDNDEQAAEVMMAEDAGEEGDEAGAGADAAAPEEATQAALGELVRSVAGPPTEVVAALADEGIEAEIVDGAVVAEARAADVRSALAARAGGAVDVYVR
ncbi:MAG TPA: zf-HC2 domain-containing protein [Gaiellaceae bacterium]|nr:zf-HC2 domain-containing protein [Gaiellaceae bacterium]